MPEPTTEAGRALLIEVESMAESIGQEWGWDSLPTPREDILAIEHEAVAQERARIPALDVEALAEALDQAMAAVGIHVDKPRPGPTREVGCGSCAKGVAAIATECAAILAARATEGGTDR